MKQRTKYGYAALLILSVLFYSIPYDWSGNSVRLILGTLIPSLFIFTLYSLWQETDRNLKITKLLWVVNSIALFHLILIYMYVVMHTNLLLPVSLVLGAIFYFFVTNHLKTLF